MFYWNELTNDPKCWDNTTKTIMNHNLTNSKLIEIIYALYSIRICLRKFGHEDLNLFLEQMSKLHICCNTHALQTGGAHDVK